MSSLDDDQIITAIENYITSCGGNYPDWYVGIASNPRNRLFQDHNVDETNGQWISCRANSSDVARTAEDYFHNVRHAQGDSGGGDNTTTFVYAYRITDNTRE